MTIPALSLWSEFICENVNCPFALFIFNEFIYYYFNWLFFLSFNSGVAFSIKGMTIVSISEQEDELREVRNNHIVGSAFWCCKNNHTSCSIQRTGFLLLFFFYFILNFKMSWEEGNFVVNRMPVILNLT